MARQRHRSKAGSRVTGPLKRSEPLTFHAPGWTIRGTDYEVICWAPGQISDRGNPTGKSRDDWMLSVERDWVANPEDGSGMWVSGGFVAGASLTEVLDALALLDPGDRYRATAILIHELGDGVEEAY